MAPKTTKTNPKSKKPDPSINAAAVKSKATSLEKKRPAEETDKPPAKRSAKKPVPVFKSMITDPGVCVPIDASYEGDSNVSLPAKAGRFTHTIKLEAPGAFTILKSIVFPPESEFAGMQALVIRPAKAFPFMKLASEVRLRVYQFYLAPQGKLDGKIVIDGRRPSNKEVFAKTYAHGSKNRLALLAVNKEVNKEASPMLYNHTLRFESTATLLDFLSQVAISVRPLLRNIDVKVYSRSSGRNALNFLAEASNLSKLRIENGMPTTDPAEPSKTARTFYQDASRFLESMGSARGEKAAGVDTLGFGKNAFVSAGEKGDAKEPWEKEEVEEFLDQLRGKLK